MLKNAYLLAKIGADTAENERNFAENLPKLATTLRVHYPSEAPLGAVVARCGAASEVAPPKPGAVTAARVGDSGVAYVFSNFYSNFG